MDVFIPVFLFLYLYCSVTLWQSFLYHKLCRKICRRLPTAEHFFNDCGGG